MTLLAAIDATVPLLLHAPEAPAVRDDVLARLLAYRDDVAAAGAGLTPMQEWAGRLELAAVWFWIPCGGSA